MSWYGSPNYTEANGRKIDRVVIHWMAGNLASTDAVFQDTARQTSAHYGIEDNTIHQYVLEKNIAWHAGGPAMNSRSIGIEHSAAPGRDASEATIQQSAKLVREVCQRYGIPIDRQHIIKHSEVPYATQCCGTIPIDRIVELAKQGDEDMTTRQTYDKIQDVAAFKFGRDFNYDPNLSIDQVLDLAKGNLPKITKQLESQIADGITGVKGVVGKDYNSPFVGQTLNEGLMNMVLFWTGQPKATTVERPVKATPLNPGIYEVK